MAILSISTSVNVASQGSSSEVSVDVNCYVIYINWPTIICDIQYRLVNYKVLSVDKAIASCVRCS